MTRKPIQITSTYADGRGEFRPCITLTALCDDGTIWDFDYRATNGTKSPTFHKTRRQKNDTRTN